MGNFCFIFLEVGEKFFFWESFVVFKLRIEVLLNVMKKLGMSFVIKCFLLYLILYFKVIFGFVCIFKFRLLGKIILWLLM